MSGAWPGNTKCIVVLTFDIDGVSGAINVNPDSTKFPGLMSLREYGPSVATPRILKMLEKNDVPATFYIPGYVAETHKDLIKLIASKGHEIGHHGYMHEPPKTLSKKEEADVLDKGNKIIQDIIGEKPKGYRAPGAELSEHTLELLSERGFFYDSSLMGDDIPYLIKSKNVEIVEVPFHWEMVDVAYFNYAPSLGLRQFMATQDHLYQVWATAFDAAYHYGLSIVPVMHPYVIGKPGRLRTLERLIKYFKTLPHVKFMRAIDIAYLLKSKSIIT